MIADRTAYDVLYSYRPVSRITVVSVSIYLLLYSFELKSGFSSRSAILPFVAKRCVLQQKCLKKGIGSPYRNTTIQLSTTSYTNPECHYTHHHRQTDGRTDRQTGVPKKLP